MDAERNNKGQFKKGHNGNKGGRPKGIAAYVKSISNDYIDYLTILDEFARDDELSVKERRACIAEILDRSLGKPTQKHIVESHNIKIDVPDGLDIEDI